MGFHAWPRLEGGFLNCPFHPQTEGTRVNTKFPGLWGLIPVSAQNADEQSEWAGEIIWTKPHYLQMRNLYCQRNICEAKQPGEYIKHSTLVQKCRAWAQNTSKVPKWAPSVCTCSLSSVTQGKRHTVHPWSKACSEGVGQFSIFKYYKLK